MTEKASCPLCEAKNNCEMNDRTKPCWCMGFIFPEQLKEKLHELPEQCICSTCAQKFGSKQKQT